MPPQKRSRARATRDHDEGDADMQDAPSHERPSASSDDSDSDDDDDDELTFQEKAGGSDSDNDDDDDDAMDGDGASAANDRLVTVDFVFSDPREDHFHSVKQFLLAYLPSSQPFNVSGLASLIVGQVAAGTMVCAEGESDVYGFLTALGLQRYKDDVSLQQVLQYITKRVPSQDAARFQQILATKNVALVVNERMVNTPYQLVPPLHSALHEDLEWAIANEATEELRAGFQFDYFLILASCSVEKAEPASKKAKGKKAKTAPVAGAKFYANFEDEFLEAEAEIAFTFETPRGDRERERERPGESQKLSVVLLIERARHKAALASIAAMINA
jgi:protein BCP1